MALVVKDRVKETTTTTGTGALSLAGAVTNFIAFSAALSDGDTTYYAIVDNTNDDFEVGLGTYASAGNTLTRTTVLASSNAGSAVNLSAGTKDVFVTYPADKSVYLDGSGNLTLGGDLVVNGYAIKTAATGDLVLQAADVLQAKYNNGGSTALYANSISGKIAIGSATVGSATITLDGSTTVTGAFTSTGIDDNATSTAITIDASQNVGIGTSSPSNPLELGSLKAQRWQTASTTLDLTPTAGATDSFVFNTSQNATYSFSMAGTERMRLDSSGTLCVGDENPAASGPSSRLYVCSEASNTGVSNNTSIPDIFVGASSTAGGAGQGGEIRFGSRVYGTSGFAAFKGYITDGTANYNLGHLDLNMRATNSSASFTRRFRWEYDGDFHADGDVIAYSTTVSDERLKDDVETIDSALDKVNSLRGVTYTWNKGSREGQRDLGVIAQEVEAVIPEIVYEKNMALLDGETYKTVDYEKLTAVLIEAVKELKAEVEALKNGASI